MVEKQFLGLLKVDLRGADLGGANLAGADLSTTDFRGANLRDADLETIESWPMPSPDDFDYAAVKRQIRKYSDYYIITGTPAVRATSWAVLCMYSS